MFTRRKRTFLVILALLFPLLHAARALQAADGAAAAESWNGWLYRTPANWQAEETAGSMVLHPGSSTANAGANASLDRVRLLPPQPADGALAQWFPRAVGQQASMLRAFRPGAVKQAKTTQGAATLYVTGQGVTKQGQRVVVTYMGLLSKNGQGLLFEAQFDALGVFRNLNAYGQFVKSVEPGMAPAIAQDAPSPTATARQPGVRAAAGSAAANATLAPATASTTGPPAAPTGHDLYDWFGSFYNSILPGPNFTISQSMVWMFYRFFPNGYVYEGLPAGVDPAAINCPAVVKGGKCKQYTLSGGTLTIAGEKPHSFAVDGSGIKIDGSTINRVRHAGRPLNGIWKTTSGGGILTTVSLAEHMLTLRPDGTFSIAGSTGVSGANVAAYGSSAGSGHYKTSGYTIEFDYANGRTVRQSFLLPYPDDKVFLIGNAMYFTPSK